MNFDIEKYESDVQQYMHQEWSAADNPMYKNEIYVNSQGVSYKVLEDASFGEIYVKVKCDCFHGFAIRIVPKIILCS